MTETQTDKTSQICEVKKAYEAYVKSLRCDYARIGVPELCDDECCPKSGVVE